MVGTTRFELATSPTPRVRSTRLSHVPTSLARAAQVGGSGGLLQHPVYTVQLLIRLSAAHQLRRQSPSAVGAPHVLLGHVERRTSPLAEEEAVSSVPTRNSCALARPRRCRRYSFSSIFLPLHPLAPGLLRKHSSCKSSGQKSESNGGSSSPSNSALYFVQNTMCAIAYLSSCSFDCN